MGNFCIRRYCLVVKNKYFLSIPLTSRFINLHYQQKYDNIKLKISPVTKEHPVSTESDRNIHGVY